MLTHPEGLETRSRAEGLLSSSAQRLIYAGNSRFSARRKHTGLFCGPKPVGTKLKAEEAQSGLVESYIALTVVLLTLLTIDK